jgi:hypothetical protein
MDRNTQINDYLFGELSDAQRADFERQLAGDPALAAEVEELGGLVTQLEALPDDAWSGSEPPPLRLPAATSEPVATNDGPGFFARAFGGSFALKPAVAFAAVLLFFLAGLGVGVLSGGSDDSTSPVTATVQSTTLAPVGDRDLTASGQADIKKDGQVIRLKISGLKPSGDADFYEAWLMDPKNGFIGLGTFRVGDDGSTTLDLPVPVGTERFPIVDISLQPADGKPEHSGVSVLRGTLN